MSKKYDRYWKKNKRYLLILLIVWFLVSFVFGIILVDYMNTIRIGGFKLGFWFAQQGSIYVFVVIIFIYVRWMNKLDKEFDVDEK
jgi:putative solute:sodium symporter small subunit